MSVPSPTPSTAALDPTESPPDYQPSINRHARGLIARIQKNRDDVEAIRLLELHYVSTGDHPSLANLMEGWGDTLKDPNVAADAYLRAADASLVGLGDRARARTLYERALSRQPGHVEALDRVLRLLHDAGDHDREKQVLKYVAYQLGETISDPQHLASVLYRLGLVYETHFGDAGKAAANYRKAIEVNPKLVPAIIAARRIYADVGNTHAVAVLYDFEIDATPAPEDKRGLLMALAELREHEQHDLDEAVIALRRALKLLPGDVEALRKLGEVLLRRSERTPQDRDPDGESAADDRRRAAEVFFQVSLGVPERSAQSYLERALTLNPAHEKAAAALRELRAVARAEGRGDESTQTFDLVEPSAEERARTADPTVETKPVRDSVEAWLQEQDVESESALSTGELLPIEPFRGTEDVLNTLEEQRPSSLPPRALAALADQGGAGLFPPQDSLRAPRMPRESEATPLTRVRDIASSAPPPRRTTMPPPPAGRPPRTMPPPAPNHAPAYAEIPGAGSEDLTPARTLRPSMGTHALASEPAPSNLHRQAEPTLIAWRLPESAADATTGAVATSPTTLTGVPAPAVTPALAVQTAAVSSVPPPAKRLSAVPTAGAKTRPSTSAPRAVPPAAQATSSSLRNAQDERVAALMRVARDRGEPASAADDALHEPRPSPRASVPATPTISQPSTASPLAALAPEPSPVAPPAAPISTPRACLVEGELLLDPARESIEVNVGATTESNFYVGFSNRLADGGVFVATYSSLPLGTEVELLVTLPGNYSARAHGRVRLTRDTFGDNVPGMCVELEALSVDALALFERFAQKRSPLFIDD